MKRIWNSWLKQTVFLYSVLYTVATIVNSVVYLAAGHKEDPNGNWHELDRAIIVFILVLAYALIKNVKLKNYWLKVGLVYAPTVLLALAYVWVVGLGEPLAASAYRDIFINFTAGYAVVSLIVWGVRLVKPKKTVDPEAAKNETEE